MTVPKQLEKVWFEELARTGSKAAACAKIGVSRKFYEGRIKRDPEFGERIAVALTKYPAQVLDVVSDGLLNGFKYQTLDRDGQVRTLRKYCSKTMLAFLTRFCNWGEQSAGDEMQGKEVTFVGHDGGELDIMQLIRAGVEEGQGMKIDPPRIVDIEEDGGFPEPE